MKKFTLMLIATFMVVFAQAAGPKRMVGQVAPVKVNQVSLASFNAKAAPANLTTKQAMARRAAKKAATADITGDYTWDYQTASSNSTDLASLETTAGSARVTIATADDGSLTVSGMFTKDLTASLTEDGYLLIEAGQLAGTSSYGDYVLNGLFYYEGDDENDAGWYYSDIYGEIGEDGVITFPYWFCRVLSGGTYDGYALTPYWVEGSTLTPADPLTVVEAPEGLQTEEYAIVARNYNDDADVSGVVQVGFDGNDVYIQGLCTYLPEAWLKGTLADGVVTFATGQYLGNYADTYDMFLNVIMNEDVVFDYDSETGTLTAQNEFFLIDNSNFYFDSYRKAVLKKVVEKAAMPANPAITNLTSSDYGYIVMFNVPNVDVNGDAMASAKLSYMFYVDVEKEVSPLTFTPATHTQLTEDMTEIPFGFTEEYDFYNGTIYLNDLYSEDWNKIGIKSIYRGGGELNETEIQWFDIKDYADEQVVEEAYTFDFNAMTVDTSSNDSSDGDIPEALEITEGDVTLTVSPKDEGKTTENRFWSTNVGPQLRCYSGTLTFDVPEGKEITKIRFFYGRWNAKNAADSGEIANDTEGSCAVWTGKAQSVVLSIAGNTQLNKIEVTVATAGDEEPGEFDPDQIDLPAFVYDFNDGTMQGWTTIDADGDGYDWALTPSGVSGVDGTAAVFSQSYVSGEGAVTPDNYLVSPKLALDGCITFYACAQDASYPAEHFGVAVSVAGNEDPADFTMADEWTLTASRTNKVIRKAQGKWYQYAVDLRGFEGQEGYVAIRHFDCSDNFYMVVDNITLKSSHVQQPDIVVNPTEGLVDALSTVTLTFNNYEVALPEAESAQAELYLNDNFDEPIATAAISVNEGKYLTFTFDEQTAKGEYTVLIPDGTVQNVATGKTLADLEYHYAIYPKDIVELPEGVEAETWYYYATGYSEDAKGAEVGVAFNGNDIYVQGLNQYYMPEAWVKGTINEDGTATFETGQYFGAFESEGEFYDMWFVGSADGKTVSDVTFSYDAEAGVLTTEDYVIINSEPNVISMYDYYVDVEISQMPPADPVEAPEGLETETYLFKAMSLVYDEDEATEEDAEEDAEPTFEKYTNQVQIGFDGDDLYIQGLVSDCPELWAKATKNEAGQYVVPANQYMGTYDVAGLGWIVYDYYFTALDEEGNLVDLVLNYDAETETFTTDQMVALNGDRRILYYYQLFTDVTITKMVEVAATPADPEVTDFNTAGKYPSVKFNIPTVDVEGNELLASKLFYQIFFVQDEKIQPLTLEAALYNNLEEDMTLIPYTFGDDYDIYTGGERVYLNQGAETIATWTNIGVQSVYIAAGETNTSNIAWFVADDPTVVGIADVKANNLNATIFDLQGRRVAQPAKGLYIVDGRKMVIK